MSLGATTISLSALTTANAQLIRSDSREFTATYSTQYEVDLAVTSSPQTFTLHNYIGASPVAIVVYNPNTVAATVLGVSGLTQTLPAGQFLFMPSFNTSSQLTLNVASGTGNIYVLLLK